MKINNIKINFLASGSNCCEINNCVHIKTMPFLSIAICLTGKYIFSLDEQEKTIINPGECFIAPSNKKQTIVHILDDKQQMNHKWIFLDVIINEIYHFDDLFDFPLKLPEEATLKLIKYSDSLSIINDDDFISTCKKDIIGLKIIKTLFEFAKEKSVDNQEIIMVINYIRTNYYKKITLGDLVKKSNFAQTAFMKRFKKITHQSPIEYLIDYRLTIVASKLYLTNDSINHISERTGFLDQFYMSKCFKKKFGISPFNYRLKVRLGLKKD